MRYAKLNAIQKAELDSIKNNAPGYYIGDIPVSLEKGQALRLNLQVSQRLHLHLRVKMNLSLHAALTRSQHMQVMTFISIINDKNEVVAQKQISVIQHQYVEEIRLIPRFEYLKRSERNRIDVIITPLNAEDANRLTCMFSIRCYSG